MHATIKKQREFKIKFIKDGRIVSQKLKTSDQLSRFKLLLIENGYKILEGGR